jgi:hypothetical protein
VAPLFSLEWWGCFLLRGVWFPNHLPLTVAPEPSAEWVAGAGHSMVGRTGTHMVLWALP